MSAYKCSFCKDPLKPIPPSGWEWLMACLLLRPYACPHCREQYFRPIATLKNLFGEKRTDTRRSTRIKGWNSMPGATGLTRAEDGHSTTSRSSDSKRSSSERSSSSSRSSKRSRGRSSESEKQPVSLPVTGPTDLSGGTQRVDVQSSVESEAEPQKPAPKEHRESRSTSQRSSRRSRQERELRRRDATIASLSSQTRPSKYRSNSLAARGFRKIKRRVRKALGLSKRSRTSSGKSRKKSY